MCCLFSAVACARADVFDAVDRALDRAGLFRGVEISGQNTFTFQGEAVEGSLDAYEGQRWDTGSFQRQSSLHLEGPIWREFGFQVDLSASGWGADYTRWVVGYVGQQTALYYGDINIGLAGNEFASFSKSLTGWQMDQRLPNSGLLRGFWSQEKGYTRNQTFSGNNTPGPYFLTYTPVIEGSLRVKVDETLMELGADYRVDYQTGELWFEPVDGPARTIPSTSTISVSYQSSGYYDSAGTLAGFRAEMPLGKTHGLVGLTFLRQDRPEAGQSDTADYQEDFYQGSGTTGPFDTNFRPILADGASVVFEGQTQTIAQALLVLVDSVPQVEGVDFDAYREIGRIIFRRAVPPTSLVRLEYYYSLGATNPGGDLDLWGLDLSYRLSSDLSLFTQWAHSAGGSGAGSALSAVLSFNRPRLQANLEWRDMDPTFSYMDSVGFYSLQSGLRGRFDWRPTQYLSVYDTYSDMKSNTGLSFGYSGYDGTSYTSALSSLVPQATTTSLDVRALRNSFGLRWDQPRWPGLSYSHDTMSNEGGSYSNSAYTTDRVELRHDFGEKLRVNASWTGNRQAYDAAGSSTQTSADSTLSQALLSLTYTPSSRLSFSANVTDSRANGSSVSATSTDSTARVMQLSARWQPSERFSVNLDRQQSTSTGSVSSGLYTSPLGVSPALAALALAPAQDSDEPAHYQDITNRVLLSYQPWDDLSLSLSLGERQYLSGGGLGYLADSDQTTANLFLTYRLNQAWSVTAGYGTDSLDFLDGGRGAVSNASWTAALSFMPPEARWGATVALNRQTGASPTYISFGSRERYIMVDTDLLDVSGQVSYRLNDRSRLYAQVGMSDFASGYSSFTKSSGGLGWQWDLGGNTQVDLGYQFIKNLAGRPTSPLYTGVTAEGQDYLANTFRLQMTTTFSGGTGGAGDAGGEGVGGSYNSGYLGGGSNSFGSTGLGTFGGYSTGFGRQGGYGRTGSSSNWFSSGSTSGGLSGGLSGMGGGWGSGQTGGYSSPDQGFKTGLGDFQQGGEQRTGEKPAPGTGLAWDQPPAGAAPGAPPGGAPWPWLEGLSRWDLLPVEEWW